MIVARLGVAALCAAGLMAPPVAAFEPDVPGPSAQTNEPAVRAEARQAERAYRQRLARLRRLREIASTAKVPDRVAELDTLYEQLRIRHDEHLDDLHARIDAETRVRLVAEIADGREHIEWVHEHRQRARELLVEHRQHRLRETYRLPAAEPHSQAQGHDPKVLAIGAAADHQPGFETTPTGHESESATRDVTHRHGDRVAQQRQERLHRVARANGLLERLPADTAVPTQREADAAARILIDAHNADAEFKRLEREIEELWR